MLAGAFFCFELYYMKINFFPFLKSIAVFLLLLLATVNMNAQADFLKKNLDKWRNDYPQEKVYLQTDKSYYIPGENMWMKAWCTGIDGPTYLSRII